MYRRLWDDPEWRGICDIEAERKPYHPSQITRFRNRVRPESLERIMKGVIDELVEGGVIDGETVVMDATFIKAYSKRDPHDNSRGSSDRRLEWVEAGRHTTSAIRRISQLIQNLSFPSRLLRRDG